MQHIKGDCEKKSRKFEHPLYWTKLQSGRFEAWKRFSGVSVVSGGVSFSKDSSLRGSLKELV